MDLDALLHGNFHQLGEAVSDWEEMLRQLKDLSDDAHKDLKKKSDGANWAGLNQQVSRSFIDKTVGEFGDAHTEADTIVNILKDTRDELVGYRRQLKDALDRALKKQLLVTDKGHGTFEITCYPERATHSTPQDIEDAKKEIEKILSAATDSDASAAKVLTRIVDQAKYGFSDAHYKDRDSAAQAIKDADDLANLMKDPEHMTPAQFDRANKIMAKRKNDPLFAEEMALKLGPKGVVNFYADVCDPNVNPKLYEARHNQLDDLQKNLGMTLATATQSDSPAMQRWEKDMIALGPDRLKDPSGSPMGVNGYQVMSALMGRGDFDDSFLTSYGKSLMGYERRADIPPQQLWHIADTSIDLNPSGAGNGEDPVTGYLNGLSHSPDAATDFLNDPYDNKQTDFQYLYADREWPDWQDQPGQHESEAGHKALALAVEAGTTGHLPGEKPDPQNALPHTYEQSRLMQSVMKSVSDHPKALTDNPVMAQSLGRSAAEYMPDIYRSVSLDQSGQENLLYPVDGVPADVDRRSATRFLFCVGEDPQGYAAVQAGQRTYMHNLLNYQLDPDVPADQRFHGSPQNAVTDITRTSATVGGVLDGGRLEGDREAGQNRDAQYAKAMDAAKTGVSTAVGIGTGVGTSFIGSPVAGAVVSGVAGTATSAAIDEIFEDTKTHYEADGDDNRQHMAEGAESKTVGMNQRAAERACKAYDVPDADDAASWAYQATEDGYNDADRLGGPDGPLSDLRAKPEGSDD
ncbi:DUF6571 family protein [Streptomyces odontomachi]|uniref:DUF6571 family protein n=1 Tax=Streptomyces odontomachi TaxID=2944940 RepID=UPI002108BF93|nr:DUF6571 family protein [Streptomyces sp. ODS25]